MHAEFLDLVAGFAKTLMAGTVSDARYCQHIVAGIFETLGFLSFKEDFKRQFLARVSPDFIKGFNYLILSAVQIEQGVDKLQNVATILFFCLNMVRSENYDIMVPSHTLKHREELNAKEASYYELKELTKLVNSSRKLAS